MIPVLLSDLLFALTVALAVLGPVLAALLA